MFEKIRLTLWDIFSFFLTGFLFACIVSISIIIIENYEITAFIEYIMKLPSSVLLVLAPLLFTLLGMLIEPLANYFDKFILNYLLWWVQKQKDNNADEEKVLENEIKQNYLGSLNGKLDSPFSICKEYVETKQLSTTFMVFLSRYGFYRNCAFLSFATGLFWAVHLCNSQSILILLIAYFLTALFKKRSEDFYSYMAPTIYRCFLIDKLDWKNKKV